jgi:hypothetical protein
VLLFFNLEGFGIIVLHALVEDLPRLGTSWHYSISFSIGIYSDSIAIVICVI